MRVIRARLDIVPEALPTFQLAVTDLERSQGIRILQYPGARVRIIIHKGAAGQYAGYYQQNGAWHNIMVGFDRPAQLYAVLLHEIGHYLGLTHTAGGVMAPVLGKTTLSLRTRAAWCGQIASEHAKFSLTSSRTAIRTRTYETYCCPRDAF
jgi:Mlc titration factor MtfA (ptsG expression regulator)